MSTLLERAWAEREEQVYPRLFGDLGPGIYPFSLADFTDVFKQDADPRWGTIGVFECSNSQGTFHYVTSGLTNPWDDDAPGPPDSDSGLGVEFVLNSTVRHPSIIKAVQRIGMYELLLAYDRYPGRERLSIGDRIPLGGPLVPGARVTHLVTAWPTQLPSEFSIQSGQAALVQLIGITPDELEFAKKFGSSALLEQLEQHGAHAVTDPFRGSIPLVEV